MAIRAPTPSSTCDFSLTVETWLLLLWVFYVQGGKEESKMPPAALRTLPRGCRWLQGGGNVSFLLMHRHAQHGQDSVHQEKEKERVLGGPGVVAGSNGKQIHKRQSEN